MENVFESDVVHGDSETLGMRDELHCALRGG